MRCVAWHGNERAHLRGFYRPVLAGDPAVTADAPIYHSVPTGPGSGPIALSRLPSPAAQRIDATAIKRGGGGVGRVECTVKKK